MEHEARGVDPVVYHTVTIEPTLYSIAITTNSTTSLQLFATTSQQFVLKSFPAIPEDGAVHVKKTSQHDVHLSWSPVMKPDARNLRAVPEEEHIPDVIYCAAMCDEASYPSDCAAKAAILGYRGPSLPKYTGFGFSKDKQRRRQIKSFRNSITRVSSKKAQYKCTKATSIVFRQLRSGTKYYISVFAVKQNTNASTSYPPVSALTKSKSNIISKFKKMHFTNFEFKVLKFQLENPPPEMTLYFKPCGGEFTVDVYTPQSSSSSSVSSSTLGSTSSSSPLNPLHLYVHHRDNLTFKTSGSGEYKVKITPERSTSTSTMGVTLTSSSDTFQDPAFQMINSSCEHTTLSWESGPHKATYCLFMGEYSSCPVVNQTKLGCLRSSGIKETFYHDVGELDLEQDYTFKLQVKYKHGPLFTYSFQKMRCWKDTKSQGV